jgi:hypothetical protein
MLTLGGQDHDDGAVSKNARNAGVAGVSDPGVQHFRNSPVPDVYPRAVAVVNLERRLAPDVHQG